MTAWALANAGTYVAQAAGLAVVAYVAGRTVIAAVDSEVARQRRSRRADGVTDIEPRAYADAIRRIHGGAR